MPFHRFDSSDATAPSATNTSSDNQNASARRLERLNAISIDRLNGEHHPLPQYSERLGRRTQPPRGAVSELTPLIYKGVMFIFQMNSYKFKLTF
jgi:hypothetical protein